MQRVCTPKRRLKKVSHVIFDLDGLLLDTESIYKKLFNDIAARFGKVYTPEICGKVIGSLELDGAIIAVEEMQLPITPQEFIDEYKSKANAPLTNVNIMSGAERLVRHFHANKIPIAVATSSNEDSFNLKTSKHRPLFDLFHHIVTGGSDPEVINGKPAPDIFLICASRFDEKPQPAQCLVFEDAPNGVQAGISAGMQVVMVPDPQLSETQCKLATLKLKTLEDMRPELFGLPPLKQIY